MSATESFPELVERLRREREQPTRRYDQVSRKPRRPPIPAPLRLRKTEKVETPYLHTKQGNRRTILSQQDPLPPPLFTGILPFRTAGYQHPVTSWRWNSYLCEWIGICPVCRYRFRADSATAAWLETLVNEYATQTSPVSPLDSLENPRYPAPEAPGGSGSVTQR